MPTQVMAATQVTGGEIAGLIAAGAFALIALALAYLLWAARKTVKAATNTMNTLNSRVGPLLNNLNTTVENVNVALTQVHGSLDGVNQQLARVDTITNHAQQVTGNVANLSTLITAAATSPLIKVASFGFGLRKATAKRRKADEEREVRDMLRADKSKTKRRGLFSKKG